MGSQQRASKEARREESQGRVWKGEVGWGWGELEAALPPHILTMSKVVRQRLIQHSNSTTTTPKPPQIPTTITTQYHLAWHPPPHVCFTVQVCETAQGDACAGHLTRQTPAKDPHWICVLKQAATLHQPTRQRRAIICPLFSPHLPSGISQPLPLQPQSDEKKVGGIGGGGIASSRKGWRE